MSALSALLERAKTLAEQASPGPWHIGHVSERGGICELASIDDAEGCCVAEVEWRRDQAFFVDSRTLVPQLVALVEEMQSALKIECFCADSDYGKVVCDPCEALARCEGIAKGIHPSNVDDNGFKLDGN